MSTSFISVDGYAEEHKTYAVVTLRAEVTENIRQLSRYCTVEANYRQIQSRGLYATEELFVKQQWSHPEITPNSINVKKTSIEV